MSPNSSFSSYIANVLPDLGEDNVSQLTQEELIKAIAYDCGFSYADRGTSFERVLASMDERLIAAMKLKNSRLFKRILDLYCKYFERTCFRPKPLFLDEDGDEFVTAEDLDFLFHSEFETSEVMKRPPLMVKYIARKNRIKDKDVLDELENQIYDMLSTCDFTQIYSGIYNDKAFFDSLDSEIKETVGEFGKYQVLPYAWEDGCAVAYLRIILAGLEQPENVFYFFADEAQDLSPVMLGVIKAAYGSADMLFAGDFAQNVFCCGEDYTESIKYNFVGKHYKKYELSVNYRSTKEISDFAGSEAGFERDISCIRRGPEPELIRASGNVAEQVSEWIKRMDEMGFVSAAVICTSRVEADNLAIDTVLPCHMKLNVRFLPVYIAKGLEYDCVLVINKDGEMRSKDKILNTNMLYTAYTRAMHCLAVIE